MSTVLFQTQSTLIVCLLLLGVYLRRKRKVHVRIMSVAIAWDIFLVAQIELTRKAVEKAVMVSDNPLTLTIHILLAISSIIGYLGLIYWGRKLLQGQPVRTLHRRLGYTTLVLRLATYVTSFFAVT